MLRTIVVWFSSFAADLYERLSPLLYIMRGMYCSIVQSGLIVFFILPIDYSMARQRRVKA